MTAPRPTEAEAAPASPREVFVAFNRLALQGFGGVLPVAQRELVERLRWLTRDQFVELLAISQVLPGPNVINLALIFGDRLFGLRGAFAALAGMLAVPILIVIALTVVYGHFAQSQYVSGALRGMGAVAAGLAISTALKLLGSLKRNPVGVRTGLVLTVLTVIATAWLRLPLVWVVLGLGAVGFTLAYRKLR